MGLFINTIKTKSYRIVSVLFAFLLVFVANRKTIITTEDHLIEWLSAIFYISSFFLGIYIYKRSSYKLVLISLILLSFVCFGEETSWLQRQLNYSVAAVESQNTQNEFNIHNLKFFSNERVIQTDGKIEFSYKVFLSSQMLFQVVLLFYFGIIPFLKHFKIPFIVDLFPVFQKEFLASFWILVIASFILAYNLPLELRNGVAETRECLYAFFLFYSNYFFVESDINSTSKEVITKIV
jgi:hypothetical protein